MPAPERVEQLPRSIDTVVFIDEPVPDGAIVAAIDDMLVAFEESGADVLAHFAPATEAVKRVEGNIVVEGIDRSALVSVRSPEVIRKPALERAVERVGQIQWVNPTALVAAHGAVVELYDSTGAFLGRNDDTIGLQFRSFDTGGHHRLFQYIQNRTQRELQNATSAGMRSEA